MTPSARPLRVAVLSELPTPYRWPLFVKAARAGRTGGASAVRATVFFYARTEADRDWGLRAETQPEGPEVVHLPGRAWHVRGKRSLFFHWNPGIGKRLRDGAFDAVVLPGWSMPTTLAAWAWCRATATPYVVFSETNDRSPRRAWVRLAKRVLLRPVVGGASAWLATGTLSAQFLARHGADPARTFRFANTPDVAAFRDATDAARPGRDAFRDGVGTPRDAVVVLFVGRLIGAKDPRTLLLAQALLEDAERAPSAAGTAAPAPWLWFAGDGTEGPELRALAASRGLRRVVFLGAKKPEELPAVFAAADVFCLPSLHEPWGVVVNEAMAARLPVVLSDRVGAGADLLDPGRNGREFPAGDAAALAEALGDVVRRSPEERARMAARSAEIVAGWDHGPSVDGFLRAVRTAARGGDTPEAIREVEARAALRARRIVLLLLVLLTAALPLALVVANPLQSVLGTVKLPRRLADAIPTDLDGWRGTTQGLDDAQMRVLLADDYVQRRYTGPLGEEATLFVTFHGNKQRGLERYYHNPTVCYPAAGWKLESTRFETVTLTDLGIEVPTCRYVFARGTSRVLVLTLFRVDDEYLDESPRNKPFWQLTERITASDADGPGTFTQVQVIVGVEGTDTVPANVLATRLFRLLGRAVLQAVDV